MFFPDQRPFGQCPELFKNNVISRQTEAVRFYSKEIENSKTLNDITDAPRKKKFLLFTPKHLNIGF